ncbi:MAG: tetratricopeptide repeat protein [Candidatus Zixiibacteriota bacterium]
MKALVIFALLLSLLMAAGCGKPGMKMTDEAPVEKVAPPSDIINRQAYTHFTNATILELLGEIPLASRQYSEALKYYPDSPLLQYSYAISLFRLGNYREALGETELIEPKGSETWLLIADSYRSLGLHDSARAAYLETVRLDSTNVSALNMLAAYYQQMEILDSAVWAYEKIAFYYPSARILQEIGNLHLRLGNIDRAKENYQLSISMDSSEANVRSYLGLSVICEEEKDRAQAKQYLETAARLSPNNALIQNRLLGFYQEDNEFDKAIATAKAVIALAPQDRNAVRRLAILYFTTDSLALADSIFAELIASGDENPVNHYYIGRIAYLGNDFPRAVSHFARVTIMADSIADGWLNLGMTYQQMDSLDLEIATYESSLKYMRSTDDSLRMMFMLGSALERKRLFERSVLTFQSILEIQPNHSQSLNYLGYMLAERGERLDYARQLILKALEIMPDNGAYIDSYGWVLYKSGDYPGAVRELKRAAEVITDDPVVFDHLGDAYKAMGDTENARKYWQKALELDSNNDQIRKKLSE